MFSQIADSTIIIVHSLNILHPSFSLKISPNPHHSTASRKIPPFCVFLYAVGNALPILNSWLPGRNIILQMQVQTLALPLTQKPSPQTLIAIMQEFSPKGLALREDRLLVLVEDPQTCALLVQKVKSGAYGELKREVFEILDSAANTSALLENSTGLFETAEQVRHFFQMPPQNATIEQEPPGHEEEGKAKLDSFAEQTVRIDLLESLYEPSGKIEVDFCQSAFQSMDSPAPESIEREVERSEEFVNAFSHEVVLEEEKEKPADNVTNTQAYSPEIRPQTDNQVQQQKETSDRPQMIAQSVRPKPLIATSHSHSPASAYLTAVLLLWICWLTL